MINVLRPPEKVIRNSKLSAIISGLYANLIGTDPKENYHSLAEFMEKSNFNGTHGLLHEVEEQCNKDGTPLTFDLIAEEEFSLNMLLSGTGYDLETYLYQEDLNPTGNELGKQISEAIVDLMKKKIKDLLRHLPDNKALKEFQSVTTNTSLSSFLTQTDSFMSTWREKIKGLHFEQTFVSNTEILQHLETKGSINATDYAGDSA
ncbi:MAG: hypothetical protein LBO09_02660 [Candidatus Peribacteria bacterium]|jgi:hypothetical protein|nr:hypothetical protein [Candidatus Peribacteria bacterium]